jgi:hypothetical protein
VGEFGIRSKYISSQFKKPLCLEFEDVKFARTRDYDLETLSSTHSQSSRVEKKKKTKASSGDDAAATYVRQMRDSFTKLFYYVMQFMPPTAMLLLQVRATSCFYCVCFH